MSWAESFTAVVLGAGRGMRLAPLTARVPKILAPVAGEPLLERQLRYLEGQGFEHVLLNAHHLAADVVSFVASRRGGVEVEISVEQEPLGTAGALLPMRERLQGSFVLLYGDVLCDVDLQALLADHRYREGIGTVVYTETDETADKGLMVLDGDERVTAFLEKPTVVPSGAVVNAGVYALKPDILAFVRPQLDFGFDVFPAVLRAGEALYGFRHDGYLRDVGSPDALIAAGRDISGGSLKW